MPLTQTQRQQIRQLLAAGVDDSNGIARRLGVPRQAVAGIKAHITQGTYGGATAEELGEIEEAGALKFGLERDLQLALRQHIDQLEEGLSIADDGRERIVGGFRIDITARDRTGGLVVVELKAGQAGPEAVGQIMGYVGAVQTEEAGAPVRAILVAGDFDEKVRLSARAIPSLELRKYAYRFTFDEPA